MDTLLKLFPPQDFQLLALILALPLLGAFVNGVFGRRLGKDAVRLMALSVVFASFVAACVVFAMLYVKQSATAVAHGAQAAAEHGAHAAHGAAAAAGEHGAHAVGEAVRFKWVAWHWMDLSGAYDSFRVPVEVAFSVDALNATMLLFVTGIGFLIHLYASSYMAEDEGYYRFFAYLNLFIFSMLVLILGDSLPVLFIGWEGVGLCSYLLIGFWFKDPANAAAGKKAFIANRIGDFGLLVAMGLLVYYVGALDWGGIEEGRDRLLQVHRISPMMPLLRSVPFIGTYFGGPIYMSAATLVCLALFLGATGKSAQLPLYVWLPDAMAGPTPVSALIHAATMVTAGVYLLCRMSAVFVLSPFAMLLVASVGAATALLAASIALVQNDLKKVLAYSTVSQLGFMFLGVGVGAFGAGFFHVLTHAFFKACLFLGAGSVIHAMHARIHDSQASQDMRYMGGLWKHMPLTHATFLVSCLAIAGFPLTSGFFSKDEILFRAFVSSVAPQAKIGDVVSGFTWPTYAGPILYGVGAFTAVLTAFYMFRLYFLTFWGDFKGWKIDSAYVVAHAHDAHGGADDAHGDDAHGHDAHGDDHHHEEPGVEHMSGPVPHESPWQMTAPLVVLGALAAFGGFLNAHALNVVGLHLVPFDNWLAPIFAAAQGRVLTAASAHSVEPVLLGAGVLIFAVGAGGAYYVYVVGQGALATQVAATVPGLYRLLENKWHVDELYEETVLGAVDVLAEVSVWLDKWVVDGLIAKLTAFVVAAAGTLLRYTQTGRVQAYAAMMMAGVVGLGWFFGAPHAYLRTQSDHDRGVYKLEAASGLGYTYRWDGNGDGKPDDEKFGEKRELEVQLERRSNVAVKLEVRNAFGQVASQVIKLERPAEDRTGLAPRGVVPMPAPAEGKGH